MSLDPDLKARILQAVDDGFADQISYTQQLVQIPSLRGHEHAIQDLLFRTLQNRGYAMDRFKMDRGASGRVEILRRPLRRPNRGGNPPSSQRGWSLIDPSISSRCGAGGAARYVG